MNAGVTADRAYTAIRQIISTHSIRPGNRLDPALLAASCNTSVTPVREALNRLLGEGLVDTRTGGGFHVPTMDAPALVDLYGWSEEVLGLILRGTKHIVRAGQDDGTIVAADIAVWTDALMVRSAQISSNHEHLRAVRDINARLHAVRRIEPEILDGVDAELTDLTAFLVNGDIDGMRARWRTYHRRRRRAAAMIIRALLRGRQA